MEEKLTPIRKITEKLLKGMTILGFGAVIIMMIWGTLDVVLQQFGSSLPATVEWTEVLNVIAVTLPLAYATYGRVHITIDLLTSRATGRTKRITNYIVMVMTFLFMSMLTWQLTIQAWRSTMMREFDQLAIKIYYFPAKIALAFAFFMASLVVLFQIVDAIRNYDKK